VAKIFDAIDDQLRTWIASQRLFFAGTAARVADSCGYGVPLMSYEGERPQQKLSAEKRLWTRGANGFTEYQRETNSTSIDRLPALEI
jgi:hypothetical protein